MTFRLCILFTLIFIPLSCGAQDKTPPGDKTVQQIQNLTLSKEKHPNLFYDETDRETMNARLHQEPWASWWKELKTHSVRSTPALTWWLLNDETEAQKSRTNLLENPIWRQKPQGYLEPSSHRFADYIVAYDLLASWEGLTPEDHRTIRNKIASEADHYYEILEGGPQGGANYGNQPWPHPPWAWPPSPYPNTQTARTVHPNGSNALCEKSSARKTSGSSVPAATL